MCTCTPSESNFQGSKVAPLTPGPQEGLTAQQQPSVRTCRGCLQLSGQQMSPPPHDPKMLDLQQ